MSTIATLKSYNGIDIHTLCKLFIFTNALRDHLEGIFQHSERLSKEVTELAEEVRAASTGQAEQLSEVTRRLEEVQRVTVTTADGATRGVNAGEQLNAQAHSLTAIADKLESIVGSRS